MAKNDEAPDKPAAAADGGGDAQTMQDVGGTVSLGKLFMFADGVDVALMLVGALGAAVRGLALPGFSLVFGDILDVLYSLELLGDAAADRL